MPPRKIKCSFGECKAAAQRISGDCAFCNGHYCNNHRLLEDHKCQNLEDVSSSPEPQWWLVGLSDVLFDEDSLADVAGSLTANSARRKPLSKTQCSSTRSAPRSSRAYNGRHRRRHRRRKPTGQAITTAASAAATTNTTTSTIVISSTGPSAAKQRASAAVRKAAKQRFRRSGGLAA